MSEETPIIHEPHLDAHPVRSALAGSKKKKDKKNRALTWDEHAIEEHDQLRGTRMKIDEANTPYSYYDSNLAHSDAESESSHHSERANNAPESNLNWASLENKLGAVAAARQMFPSSPSDSGLGSGGSGPDSDGEREALRKEIKSREFRIHRKAHYNEMEAIRRWREEHQDDEDEDDDEGNEMEM